LVLGQLARRERSGWQDAFRTPVQFGSYAVNEPWRGGTTDGDDSLRAVADCDAVLLPP